VRISLKQYGALLVQYLRPQKSWVLILAVLLFGNIGLQLINPLIMRRFLDTALAGGSMDVLSPLAFTFIGVAAMQQLVAVGATLVSENVAWTATNWLRNDLARHCLYLDLPFHQKHTPGEMIERIDGDVNTLSTFFSQFTLQILGNGILLLGVMVLLFREDLRVGLSIAVFVVLTLLILNAMRNLAVPHWRESRQSSADFFSFLEERLAGTEEIRANGAQAYVMRRFHELLQHFWRTTVKARLMGFSMVNVGWVLFAVGNAVAFVVGAHLYRTGALTLGSVYLIFHYTNMLAQPIQRISQEIEQLQQAGAGVARIQELHQVERQIQEPAAHGQIGIHNGGRLNGATPAARGKRAAMVTFETLSFAYANDNEGADLPNGDGLTFALNDLSFHLQPGTILGLLGRTGSGKTTLTRLLFRLYDPSAGRICLNGVDLRQIPLSELRQQVGMVTQNVQLFRASIRDNLTFFDPSVPDAQIEAAIETLGLARWYASLERGLDTTLESGGGGLSAGEAQLLAFTRIFLRDPGLIVLDEASSRLDPATEQLIESAVDRLLQNRTGIIIAHRLGTVQRADEIMILENGRIREHGARRALADDPTSHFYHLLQTGMQEALA
jgi:ATP-binding cassette subfamily B protein/ATP-binding cassette subfamily C protein